MKDIATGRLRLIGEKSAFTSRKEGWPRKDLKDIEFMTTNLPFWEQAYFKK